MSRRGWDTAKTGPSTNFLSVGSMPKPNSHTQCSSSMFRWPMKLARSSPSTLGFSELRPKRGPCGWASAGGHRCFP
eukprot:7403149-Alexandrium_andersonii.AAC.1